MFKPNAPRIAWLATAVGCALTGACSSGGGGAGTGPPVATATAAPAPASASGTTDLVFPPPGNRKDTGIAGSVAAPGAASFSSAAAQLAMQGGPTFDGSSGSYPANVTFPLLSNSLQAGSAGLSAVAGNQGATATVVNTSAAYSTLHLTIPSIGVDATIAGDLTLVNHLGGPTDGLSYAVMGGWLQGPAASPTTVLQSATVFVFGYETPQSAMPSSGTAVFSGPGLAAAYVYKPVGTEINTDYAQGNPSLSVNFGSGAVNGSFTNMQLLNGQPWNDVSVSANIAAGSNRFSGTTAAASAPGTAMSLSGSATGRIDGAFFGPAAQNLGAVWSLSDGSGSALGTVVAGH